MGRGASKSEGPEGATQSSDSDSPELKVSAPEGDGVSTAASDSSPLGQLSSKSSSPDGQRAVGDGPRPFVGCGSASGSGAKARTTFEGPLQLFVLVHGICGSSSDWDVWRERLEHCGRSDWDVRAATSITRGATFAGSELCELSRLLAREVISWVQELLATNGKERALVVNFICHSLGGLVARTALPEVCESLDEYPNVSYGHFLTLNTPHLGVHSATLLLSWKNLATTIPAPFFKQVHQLTLQDRVPPADLSSDSVNGTFIRRERRRRFLEDLADPQGRHCTFLTRFKHRTAVGATHWDIIVPFCTAAICTENPFTTPNVLTGHFKPFWRVDAAVGFEAGSRLHEFQVKGGDRAAAFAAGLVAMGSACASSCSSSSPGGGEVGLGGTEDSAPAVPADAPLVPTARVPLRASSLPQPQGDSASDSVSPVFRSAFGSTVETVFTSAVEDPSPRSPENPPTSTQGTPATGSTKSAFTSLVEGNSQRTGGWPSLSRQSTACTLPKGAKQSLSEDWIASSDREVSFPTSMLMGLAGAAPWRRIAYTLHQPWWGHGDVHVFSIGKDCKVREWSVEFIDLLISMFQEEPAIEEAATS